MKVTRVQVAYVALSLLGGMIGGFLRPEFRPAQAANAPEPDKVLRCQRLIVVDEKGQMTAGLGPLNSGTCLAFFDGKKNLRATFGFTQQHPTISSAGLTIYSADPKAVSAAEFFAMDDGLSALVVHDEKGHAFHLP